MTSSQLQKPNINGPFTLAQYQTDVPTLLLDLANACVSEKISAARIQNVVKGLKPGESRLLQQQQQRNVEIISPFHPFVHFQYMIISINPKHDKSTIEKSTRRSVFHL